MVHRSSSTSNHSSNFIRFIVILQPWINKSLEVSIFQSLCQQRLCLNAIMLHVIFLMAVKLQIQQPLSQKVKNGPWFNAQHPVHWSNVTSCHTCGTTDIHHHLVWTNKKNKNNMPIQPLDTKVWATRKLPHLANRLFSWTYYIFRIVYFF